MDSCNNNFLYLIFLANVENTKIIAKWLSVRKSVSGYSWREVAIMFGIKDVEYGNIIISKFELGHEYVDQGLRLWKIFSSALFPSSFPGENDAERKVYVISLLLALPVWDKFTLGLEYPVKNASITDTLDFAIIAFAPLLPIVCVI